MKASYGLYNVSKRLRLYYDGKVSLDIKSVAGEGSEVSFVIPRMFDTKEESGNV